MPSSTPTAARGQAVIIGAGISGLASAYYLLKEGWDVTVVDRSETGDNCSYGNAGMIVPSHFIPMAAPGIISTGIKWMFDSRSPFYVKPSLDWSLISWGIRFARSATSAHVARSAPVLRDYHLLSHRLYQELSATDGFDFGLENKGILMLYKSSEAEKEEHHVAEQARELGLDAAPLDSKAVQALEPHLNLDVAGAVHYRCDAHLYPKALMTQLAAAIEKKGGKILPAAEVKSFVTQNGRIDKVVTTSATLNADLVVMTGGAWLPQLARLAGLHIPVMPGKGYSFMEPNHDRRIIHPSLLIEARVAVTPMNGAVRFGGTMEIAPVNNKINRKRLEGIVNAIPRYYPDLKVEVPAPERTWFGFRPCSADGLPYLGFSRKIENLIVAGGHGMMGLSLGPATGKIVAELAAGLVPSVDIVLYDPLRFN